MKITTKWEDKPLYCIGRMVFRGCPNSTLFIGWSKSIKGKLYDMTLSREHRKVESIDTIESIYKHRIRLNKELFELNESIQNIINDMRRNKATYHILKKLPVHKTEKTTNEQIENILEKGKKAKAISWNIINRIERTGRSYKTDGDKIHRGFDRKKASERLVRMIKKRRDGELYYYDSMGLVRLNIKRLDNGICDFKYISLLTNKEVTNKRKYVFENPYYVRTKGDINHILFNIKEKDLICTYEKVKKLRLERHIIKAMLEELNREERKVNEK